jgi:hypothetical protein
VSCDDGYRCEFGVCRPDPCHGYQCPTDQECVIVDGTAVCNEGCENISCLYGRTCVLGECIDDPCNLISCPEGQICIDSNCLYLPEDSLPDGGDVDQDQQNSTDSETQQDTDGAEEDTPSKTEKSGGCSCTN